MSVNLVDYRVRAREAVKFFWANRQAALGRQSNSGVPDVGGRGAVIAGKNMDGFASLSKALFDANGLAPADVCERGKLLKLPGYFRRTKLWDMLVLQRGTLVAALEFKLKIGPSFGNNFNNRVEEAVGSAQDLWTAYRKGAFGKDALRLFLGWIMLLEDCDASRKPVSTLDPHFTSASRIQRGIAEGLSRMVSTLAPSFYSPRKSQPIPVSSLA